MNGTTRNMIRNIGGEWKKIGEDRREICFPGIVGTYS